jgi:hypothetical protein
MPRRIMRTNLLICCVRLVPPVNALKNAASSSRKVSCQLNIYHYLYHNTADGFAFIVEVYDMLYSRSLYVILWNIRIPALTFLKA